MKTNDIFDLRRFGRYLVADGKAIISKFGLDVLIMSFCGLGMWALLEIMHLFGMMTFWDWGFVSSTTLYAILLMALVIMFGSKCYGHVTDKKAGAMFLQLPASTLEKTLSIVIYSLVVPVVFSLVYMSVDWVMSKVITDYGSSIFTASTGIGNLFVGDEELAAMGIGEGAQGWWLNPLSTVDDIMNAVLIFVVGALCFKRNKVAKTLGVIMIVAIVGSTATFSFTPSWFSNPEATDIFNMIDKMAVADIILDLLGLLGLSTAVYFRLKSIKL